ncbi:MAG TPA: hypothetical protein VJ851_05975 [Jatrophihabitans sp.]|nr:hypothetical protein [Jatrophihabitans sp.]
MGNQLATEQDLRHALRSLAPDDIDATRFRERLDRMLASQPPATPPLSPDHAEAMLLSTDWPDPHGRSRSRRMELGIAVALAACAAAVLALFLSVLSPEHSERRPSTPALNAPVPAAIQSMLLPGTTVLDTYAGRGSQSFLVPPRVIPPHFGYEAYGTCTGGGTLRIAQQSLFGACDGGGAFGTGGAVENGRLVITAANATSWQITLTIAPDLQTNGSVQGPVDQDMTGPDNALRQSGQGPGTVAFPGETPAPPAGTKYRLRLVCHGSGVNLPNLTTPDASGLQTKTCFAGHEYVWDYVSLPTPIRIRVDTPAGTTWTLAIGSM